MYYASFQEEGYSEIYLNSRKQLDKICDLVVLGSITPAMAMAEYNLIEKEFYSQQPEMAVLFDMIYKKRIERLCAQFPPEKI